MRPVRHYLRQVVIVLFSGSFCGSSTLPGEQEGFNHKLVNDYNGAPVAAGLGAATQQGGGR